MSADAQVRGITIRSKTFDFETSREIDLSNQKLLDDDIQPLCANLGRFRRLKSIVLNENCIGNAGACALADSLKQNSSVESLSLYWNQIGDQGACSLGDCLKVNGCIQHLFLENNDIGNDGARALGDGLKVGTSKVSMLKMHGNIKITEEPLKKLESFDYIKESRAVYARCLERERRLLEAPSVAPELKNLNLGDWNEPFAKKPTIFALMQKILDKGCSAVVQKLNLSRNGLTPAHIPELQPLLRQFTALTEIDVSYNPLDAALPDLAQFINPECNLVTFRADAFSSDNSESDKTKYQALSSESVCKCLLSLISFRTLAQVSFAKNSCGTCSDVVKSLAWGSFHLATPPDEIIAKGGWNGVVKFLKQKEFHAVFKTRLMFIGRGVSGKTRLVRTLLQPGSTQSIDVESGRTIGIDLSYPSFMLPGANGEDDIEAVPWDFAGQELSYLSHSVHLSARCVYLLVWSPRKEEDESSADTAEGIVQPMFEWLQILSSHVPDANIVLVGTHSRTPERKEKPGLFKDGSYVEKFENLARDVKISVEREIDRLNSIVMDELKILRDVSLPDIKRRLTVAERQRQILLDIVGAPLDAAAHMSTDRSTSEQNNAYHDQLNQQATDTSVPHELRKCTAEVLHLTRLESTAHERMRRLCGVRDGSLPRADAAPVRMQLMMCAHVDSSNRSGISELKRELALNCRRLPFIGERVPIAWTRVEAAIDKLQQQALTAHEACREIMKVMEIDPQSSLSAAKSNLNEGEVMEALEFWSQLGRVIMQDGQFFPKPQLVVDLIRPLVHHKPMNLLRDTEGLKLLRPESIENGALLLELKQHLVSLGARNEVHEEFLHKHVTSWSNLSEEQMGVMLRFFVACALLSKIEGNRGTFLVTARLRNLPPMRAIKEASASPDSPQLQKAARSSTAGTGAHTSEEIERHEIFDAKEKMIHALKESLQPFMHHSHCAMQVLALVLGISQQAEHQVSSTLSVRSNEAFFLLPIRHIAVLSRLQAQMSQLQPRGISLDMKMFCDGVVISRDKSLCATRVCSLCDIKRSPQLQDHVDKMDCVLHVVSNDIGMFRFLVRCIEGIIETAFAGLRYQCFCPNRDQHGNTVGWIQFQARGALAIEDSLSEILQEKNIHDAVFEGKKLNQIFQVRCPVFISHSWSDGTGIFVKRLKSCIESMAMVSAWCDFTQMDQKQGSIVQAFRQGLCEARVIIVCLTPRYLTRPNCLRELKWALDFAYKGGKDVRILPLHPALTFPAINDIPRHSCVCVTNADGSHVVHKLSQVALDLVKLLKQEMCLNWTVFEPWASDALGDFWLPPDDMSLVNELVSKISDKLGFNDQPSKTEDCQPLDDKDLESIVVAESDIPVNLLDSYPELKPDHKHRVADYKDKKERFEAAVTALKNASSPAKDSVAGSSIAAGSSSIGAAQHAAAAAPAIISIQGVYTKSKTRSWPLLTKKLRYITVNAEGFKWFKVASSGGKGTHRGTVEPTKMRGATIVDRQWHGLFGVEAQYLDASDCLDVLVVWCKNATEQKEMLAAINSLCGK